MGSSKYEWGPYAWYKFHKKAIKYPSNPCNCNIKNAIYFYQQKFLDYIDCKSCRKDYLALIQNYPIKTGSKLELFNWTVAIHNIINVKLGKKQISYDKAYKIWSNKSFCKCKPNKVYLDIESYLDNPMEYLNSIQTGYYH